MKTIIFSSALVLLAGSLPTHAAESPKWNFATLSYSSVDFEGETLTGLGVSGAMLVSDNVFLAAAYGEASDDIDIFGERVDLEVNSLSIGMGYRHPIAPNTDLFGVVSYEDAEAKAGFLGESSSASDSGYGLQGGVRSMVTDRVELAGALQYVDIADESDTAFSLRAQYFFTEQFSAGVGYSKSDDVDETSFSLSLYF